MEVLQTDLNHMTTLEPMGVVESGKNWNVLTGQVWLTWKWS